MDEQRKWYVIFFLRFYLFIFRERGREGETGRERPVGCLSCAPNWGPGPQPSMCPAWELNWQPLGSQASTQSLSHTHKGKKCYLETECTPDEDAVMTVEMTTKDLEHDKFS